MLRGIKWVFCAFFCPGVCGPCRPLPTPPTLKTFLKGAQVSQVLRLRSCLIVFSGLRGHSKVSAPAPGTQHTGVPSCVDVRCFSFARRIGERNSLVFCIPDCGWLAPISAFITACDVLRATFWTILPTTYCHLLNRCRLVCSELKHLTLQAHRLGLVPSALGPIVKILDQNQGLAEPGRWVGWCSRPPNILEALSVDRTWRYG